MSTKVSVLLSTYNGEKYINELINSINSQDIDKFELVVRDDGSNDNTLKLIEQNKGDVAVRILSSDENLGSAKSFFLLLRECGAKADYYAFADQDDIWGSDKLSQAIGCLEGFSSDKPVLYCSRLEYVDDNLNHLMWSRVPRKIGFGNALVENIATGCTVVINESARKLIVSKLPRTCVMHDWWFYLVISCFGEVFWDEYSGIKYRQHDSNVVGAATTFFGDVKRRLKRFFNRDRQGIFSLSSQAEVFYELFYDDLTEEVKSTLQLLIRGKTSFFQRIKLVFSKNIWRQRLFDDFIMRVVILIGRY